MNVALQVGTTRQLVKQFVFGPKLAALNSGMESSIAAMMAEVPSAPWTVHLYVATSAASDHGAAWKLANARVRAVVDRVRSQLEAAGITVVVETTVWKPARTLHECGSSVADRVRRSQLVIVRPIA